MICSLISAPHCCEQTRTSVCVCVCHQVRWWWSWNTANMGTCPTSSEPRESFSSHIGYKMISNLILQIFYQVSWAFVFFLLFFFFIYIFLPAFQLFSFCSSQDRSPKTQSQVRRMIEAGQTDQRTRNQPPPSSSPDTVTQKPAGDKSESMLCLSTQWQNSLCRDAKWIIGWWTEVQFSNGGMRTSIFK